MTNSLKNRKKMKERKKEKERKKANNFFNLIFTRRKEIAF